MDAKNKQLTEESDNLAKKISQLEILNQQLSGELSASKADAVHLKDLQAGAEEKLQASEAKLSKIQDAHSEITKYFQEMVANVETGAKETTKRIQEAEARANDAAKSLNLLEKAVEAAFQDSELPSATSSSSPLDKLQLVAKAAKQAQTLQAHVSRLTAEAESARGAHQSSAEKEKSLKAVRVELEEAKKKLTLLQQEAEKKASTLDTISSQWLPPWLADRLEQSQRLARHHWHETVLPAAKHAQNKTLSALAGANAWAGPRLEYTKKSVAELSQIVKEYLATAKARLHSHREALFPLAADYWNQTAEALGPHYHRVVSELTPHVNATYHTVSAFSSSASRIAREKWKEGMEAAKPMAQQLVKAVLPIVEEVKRTLKPHTDALLLSLRPHLQQLSVSLGPHINRTATALAPHAEKARQFVYSVHARVLEAAEKLSGGVNGTVLGGLQDLLSHPASSSPLLSVVGVLVLGVLTVAFFYLIVLSPIWFLVGALLSTSSSSAAPRKARVTGGARRQHHKAKPRH